MIDIWSESIVKIDKRLGIENANSEGKKGGQGRELLCPPPPPKLTRQGRRNKDSKGGGVILPPNLADPTMKTNLPKTLYLLIFSKYSLNFSLKFFIMIIFCEKSTIY